MNRESVEQLSIGSLGIMGVITPGLVEVGQAFQAITIIFSFFFIVLPTAVWACCRAYRAVKRTLSGEGGKI